MSLPITGIAENGQAVFGPESTAPLKPIAAERLALHREQEKRGEPVTLTRAEKSALDAQLEENCRIADDGGDVRWALAHSDYHPWVLAVGLELIAQWQNWEPDECDSEEEAECPSFSSMLETTKEHVETAFCPLAITG